MSAGKATTQDKPITRAAPEWSKSHYLLAVEPGTGRYRDVLAVCAIHPDQPHVRHGSDRAGWWCQSLPPHDRRHVRAAGRRSEPQTAASCSDHADALLDAWRAGWLAGRAEGSR